MIKRASVLYMNYGRTRLTTDEVAQELGLSAQTVRNQLSEKSFPIPSYKEGKHRYFDVQAVGSYLDSRASAAA